MPKFTKAFGRRKSSGNNFEDVQVPRPTAVEHTFKVFERPDGAGKSFDGGVKLAKATNVHSTAQQPLGPKASQREDNMFEDIMHVNRGSGASNSNTTSTTDNSSRLSAASTAPSSTHSRGEESRSPNERPSTDYPLPPIPKTQSAFSLKSAGRSLSWGRNKQSGTPPPPPPIAKDLPSPLDNTYKPRKRTVTASSYASTATPPKLDDKDLGFSLGGDFGDMFSGFDKRKSQMLEAEKNRSLTSSPEHTQNSQPSSRLNVPSPLHIDKEKSIDAAPLSWASHHSRDGLISSTSSPALSPRNDENAPPVPAHSTQRKQVASPPSTMRNNVRPPLAETGLRRNSAYSGRRQSTVNMEDEDAKLLRESIAASRRMNEPSYSSKVRDSWALPSNQPYKVDDATIASWTKPTSDTTPKAPKASLPRDDSMFDDISASANLAQKFTEAPMPPQKPAAPSKVMSRDQFERLKQDQEQMRSSRGHAKEEEEDEEEDNYDDEEDEIEKNKQLAKQRRKQEAHMAIYRQQMMKVTGDNSSPAGSPMSSGKSSSLGNRPAMYSASQSTPNLAVLGVPEEGEEEDEEVPLGILQAHGFPNKSKPPMRSSGSNPNLRAPGPGGPLPVFARRLPEDPYYGAGIVHPSYRESMAFAGGSPARNAPPGGLVGVIATEERSRAMRRGSPNQQGEYAPPSPAGLNGMGMPMMNGMGPMGQMPMMHGDQNQVAAQMQQMQEFMRVQMQFMSMMSQGGQGPNGQMNPQMMNGMTPQMNGMPQLPQQDFQRPNSAHGFGGGSPMLRPGSSHQRTMSMMDPNAAPWMQPGGGMFAPSMHGQGGYAPSIAPSERSNIGLPGRYRPVSHAPPQFDTRSSTMTGGLNGWDTKSGSMTVKAVKQSGKADDEDDEEGWEEMAKKRQEKKSIWKSKAKKDSDNNGLKDFLSYN